jgi:hypothetical protein
MLTRLACGRAPHRPARPASPQRAACRFRVACSTPSGSAWLLLELCSTSLHQVLRHCGTLEEAQIAAVCAGTLRGLDWLHASCRIVHQVVESAVLAAPQLARLASWGWLSRLPGCAPGTWEGGRCGRAHAFSCSQPSGPPRHQVRQPAALALRRDQDRRLWCGVQARGRSLRSRPKPGPRPSSSPISSLSLCPSPNRSPSPDANSEPDPDPDQARRRRPAERGWRPVADRPCGHGHRLAAVDVTRDDLGRPVRHARRCVVARDLRHRDGRALATARLDGPDHTRHVAHRQRATAFAPG